MLACELQLWLSLTHYLGTQEKPLLRSVCIELAIQKPCLTEIYLHFLFSLIITKNVVITINFPSKLGWLVSATSWKVISCGSLRRKTPPYLPIPKLVLVDWGGYV
eukprot:COSAG05_NODE_1888_length_3885_cov_17.913629_2_plen_105_part_00